MAYGYPDFTPYLGLHLNGPLQSEPPAEQGEAGAWDMDANSSILDAAIQAIAEGAVVAGFLGLNNLFSLNSSINMNGGVIAAGLTVQALTALSTSGISLSSVGGSATAYTYVIEITDVNGNGVTTSKSISNGPAALSGVAYNVILIQNAAAGPATYKLYRTVGGATQGLIATMASTSFVSSGSVLNNEIEFVDTGLAGDSSVPPTGNASGSIVAGGPISAGQYTVATLPTGVEGMTAYATDACKAGETSAGTGASVYFSNGSWRVVGSDAVAATTRGGIQKKTGNYVAIADDVVLCDTSGGGFAVTIPLSANNKGKQIRVKKVSTDANVLTVTCSGSDGIDTFGGSITTNQPGTAFSLVGDGTTTWEIF